MKKIKKFYCPGCGSEKYYQVAKNIIPRDGFENPSKTIIMWGCETCGFLRAKEYGKKLGRSHFERYSIEIVKGSVEWNSLLEYKKVEEYIKEFGEFPLAS